MASDVIGPFAGPYRFLSNFFEHPFEFNGVVYPTAEHAFQCAKTTDPSDIEYVRLARTPAEAKKRGRKVKLIDKWDSAKDSVMEAVVRAKFTPSSPLAQQLVDTYPAQLIEVNTWNDTYWGVCKGNGKNRLGNILMEVRDELIAIGSGKYSQASSESE